MDLGSGSGNKGRQQEGSRKKARTRPPFVKVTDYSALRGGEFSKPAANMKTEDCSLTKRSNTAVKFTLWTTTVTSGPFSFQNKRFPALAIDMNI